MIGKTAKKPVLFMMAEDNASADDVAAKDLQGKRWTEEISKRLSACLRAARRQACGHAQAGTGTKWTFLRVDQKEFEKARYNKFAELTL